MKIELKEGSTSRPGYIGLKVELKEGSTIVWHVRKGSVTIPLCNIACFSNNIISIHWLKHAPVDRFWHAWSGAGWAERHQDQGPVPEGHRAAGGAGLTADLLCHAWRGHQDHQPSGQRHWAWFAPALLLWKIASWRGGGGGHVCRFPDLIDFEVLGCGCLQVSVLIDFEVLECD